MTLDNFKNCLEEARLGIQECSNIILKQEVTKNVSNYA